MLPWLEVVPGVCVTASGAAWLPAHDTLVVADVHLGYELSARRRGGYLPTPERADEVAARIVMMAGEVGARRIVIAGDLRHSTTDVDEHERDAVARLALRIRETHALVVLSGNHDRGGALTGEPALATLALGSTCITHVPPSEIPDVGVLLCGHLHPRITLRDEVGAAAPFRCALVSDRLVVLPAFSGWAGGVEASRLVRELPPALWRAIPLSDAGVADVGVVFDTR